jgi:hypothetical protein
VDTKATRQGKREGRHQHMRTENKWRTKRPLAAGWGSEPPVGDGWGTKRRMGCWATHEAPSAPERRHVGFKHKREGVNVSVGERGGSVGGSEHKPGQSQKQPQPQTQTANSATAVSLLRRSGKSAKQKTVTAAATAGTASVGHVHANLLGDRRDISTASFNHRRLPGLKSEGLAPP